MTLTIPNSFLSMMTFSATCIYCPQPKYKKKMTMCFLMRLALSISIQFTVVQILGESVLSSAKMSLKMCQWEQRMNQLQQTPKKSILSKFTYVSFKSRWFLKWATIPLAIPILSQFMSLVTRLWENYRPRLPSPYTVRAPSITTTRSITWSLWVEFGNLKLEKIFQRSRTKYTLQMVTLSYYRYNWMGKFSTGWPLSIKSMLLMMKF
jgi:hypothetical protein